MHFGILQIKTFVHYFQLFRSAMLCILLSFNLVAKGQPPFSTYWSIPASLGDSITTGVAPHVASNGNSWLVVYSAYVGDGADYEVMFSRSDNGVNWSNPAVLNSDWNSDLSHDVEVKVAGSSDGKWICVWQRFNTVMISRSIDNGLTWSEPKTIGTGTMPSIAYFGASEWLVACGNPPALLRTLDDGVNWLEPQLLAKEAVIGMGCNTQPCTVHSMSNPVICDTLSSDTIIVGMDVDTVSYPNGYIGGATFYDNQFGLRSEDRGYTFPSLVNYPHYGWLNFEGSKNAIVTGTNQYLAADEYGSFREENLITLFSHPYAIKDTSRVTANDQGNWIGLSVVKLDSVSSETAVAVTYSSDFGHHWETTQLIDSSSIDDFGKIKLAEINSSNHGQFVTVFEVVDISGNSTIWCSTFNLSSVDSDNDGVTDDRDLCPATPAGEAVDSTGCLLDTDKDGVPDKDDQCPDTPEGEIVDNLGCILDTDGDGVRDLIDQCPNTPVGDIVDAAGCTIPDLDGDGVLNEVDQCPETPEGDVVDANGCSILQNCPCEGPREGDPYKNKKGLKKCIRQQAALLVKEKRITKKQRKALLKQYKSLPCIAE